MSNLTATAPNQITFLADSDKHQFRFDIPSSDGSNTYRIAQQKKDAQWQCGCPSWIYQKGPMADRKPCKHLRAMNDLLLQIEGKAPAAQPRVAAKPAALPAGKDAAAAQIAALVATAEREAADAHAKWIAAQAKVDALRLALKAAA